MSMRFASESVHCSVDDEDFDMYLYVKSEKIKGVTSASDGGEGDDHAQSEDGRVVSYGQLSALAALSAAKNPSTAAGDQHNNSRTSNNTSPSSNSASNRWSSNTQQPPPVNSNPPASFDQQQALSIGQTLVRKLIKTVTRYSDAHGLDREHEIREFLSPIEARCQMRNEKAALKQLLPAYAGYTLSLVTGNPLPLLIGAVALTQPDPMHDENSNVSGFRAVGGRAGDMETTGLLDECESD